MSSYCQCGHVWGIHAGADEELPEDYDERLLDEDDEGYPPPAGMCLDEEGCDCEAFENLSPEEYAALDRGYD